jgi:hypothetical protein
MHYIAVLQMILLIKIFMDGLDNAYIRVVELQYLYIIIR